MSNIYDYIPQRPPFVMIDEVLKADDASSVTAFEVREDNIFIADGFLTEPALVENMAQTAAAGTGMKAANNGKPAPVGFIGALKNVKVDKLPKVGDVLNTEIAFLHQIMNAHIVHGTVKVNEEVIASCELKIFLQEGA